MEESHFIIITVEEVFSFKREFKVKNEKRPKIDTAVIL